MTSPGRRTAVLDAISCLLLTVLVWGVNACTRGLWQDDVQALGEAFRRSERSFQSMLAPDPAPLRRLTLLPSALANLMPHPIWALQLLSASVWLAQAVVAGWLVALLLPGRRWTRFAVVCLTLTATSDFTTGSIVPLAYNVAALAIMISTACGLIWLKEQRITAVVMSVILLVASLLTMDVAVPAVPFLLALFLWAGRGQRRRAAVLLVAWIVPLVPIAIIEWSFLHDPSSYAAMALLPMTRTALIKRAVVLWLVNFAPWRWAFSRPDWYVRPATAIRWWWMAAGSAVAALLFLFRAREKNDLATASESKPAGENEHARLALAALFGLMALASNTVYAAVWFSELHYRTHILSRVWASLAIGLLAGWAMGRGRNLQRIALVVVTLFIFFGTWGGFERQDFYQASWREHQRELASILSAAPALRSGTWVILRGTAEPGRYLANGADYLTRHWLRLLYDDAWLQTLRLNPVRGSGCAPSVNTIECWMEGQEACFLARTCRGTRVRLEKLVVFDYAPETATWRLVRSLENDPLSERNDASRYRPEACIIRRPLSIRQRRLLLME